MLEKTRELSLGKMILIVYTLYNFQITLNILQ